MIAPLLFVVPNAHFSLTLQRGLVVVSVGATTPMELTTWKAVAAHLGVHIRTVQAWERDRGFPVQRLPGGRGRIMTTTEDIEHWKQTPTINAETSPAYRWPLGNGITAEIRFTGKQPTSDQLEILRQYLDIAKNALNTTPP